MPILVQFQLPQYSDTVNTLVGCELQGVQDLSLFREYIVTAIWKTQKRKFKETGKLNFNILFNTNCQISALLTCIKQK